MSRLNVDTTVAGDQNQRYSFMETPLEMHSSSHQREFSSPLPADPDASQRPAVEELQTKHQRAYSYEPSEKEQIYQHQGIIPDSRPPLEEHPANYAPLAQQQQPQLHHSASMPLQSYTTPMYSNISTQHQQQWPQQIGMTISPQYANASEHQRHGTPMSPLSYVSHPYATQSQRDIQSPQRDTPMSPQTFAYTEPPSSPPPHSPGPLPLKVNPEAPSNNETMAIVPDANPLQSPTSPYFPPPTRAATSHAPPDDLRACHQPGQTIHPNQEVTGGGWSNKLCEFSNFGICCLGMFCPCILYGRTQHRLSMKSKKEDPTNMLGYETCNGSCTAMGLLCGCQWLLATVQHTRTRKAYGIQGSIASDCVRASCCTCCTLIQDEKEIHKREEYRARAARERGPTLLSPYTTPGPMSYGPPK